MKDKISKIISLIKKYGIIKTAKKILLYIYSKITIVLCSLNIKKNKKISKKFDDILNSNQYDRIIIWRSNFGWDVSLFQRPQHMANNLSKCKCLVIYEVTYFTDKIKDLKEVDENIILCNFDNKFINKIINKKLNNINKPKYVQIYSTDWKMKLKDMKQYIEDGYRILYEYIDEIDPLLSGTKEIPINIKEKYEYMLKDTKNIFVVVTAEKLRQDVLKMRGNEKLVFANNGVDYEFYQKFDESYEYEENFKKILRTNKYIIGYYGAFASWFDYELIKNLALERPEYNIVLIGTKYDDSFEKSNIYKIKNIYYLGEKKYQDLKNYSKKFNVCIVPFVINNITNATSPLKIFEYMALKKPIVTTAMNECKKYKSIFIANSKDEFIKFVDLAINIKDTDYFECLEREAKENTWIKKAEDVVEMLKNNEKEEYKND